MTDKRADLGSNLDETTLFAEEAAKPKAKRAAKKAPAKKAAVDKSDYVWMLLEENQEIPPTGLFIGHNGVGYTLMPGVAAHVPQKLIGILDDAVMSMPQRDPQTQQVIGYRDQRRYAYRLVEAPAEG